MAKEIIMTIKKGKDILHGILNEDTMIFSAIGMERYGYYTTTINLEGTNFKILKETVIEWDDNP